MSKHKKTKAPKQKLYWWQRKRLIQMRIRAWLLHWQEFKTEFKEINALLDMELRKMMNGEKHDR